MGTTVRRHRPSPVTAMLLALLMSGLATIAYAALSGPAIVGALTLVQNGSGADLVFAGQCKGNSATFVMNVTPYDVGSTTAASLEGLSLPGKGPSGCLSQNGGEDLIINTVVTPRFMKSPDGTMLTAEVVLLYTTP